jgi:hypothetical protein
MNNNIKQTGLIIEFPKPTDYVAGKETPIKSIKNPSGDWSGLLPKTENQFNASFDTMSCTTFSACNSIEMLLKLAPQDVKNKLFELGFDSDFNISDRFVAIMSGTTKQGNTFGKVADTIRTIGFIPEQDLPFGDVKTWEEYHNALVITEAMKQKAAKVLEVLDIFYDWVFFDNNPDFTDDQYSATENALKYAPVQIGIQTPATHAINMIKLEKRNNLPYYKIFDHYPNYIFEGDSYKPHFGLRFSVESKTVIQNVYPAYIFTKYLQYGLRNNAEVKMLQQVLIVEGCLAKGLDTGNFYDQTLRAVKTFQAKYGIQTTGNVGPITRTKLNELCQKKK